MSPRRIFNLILVDLAGRFAHVVVSPMVQNQRTARPMANSVFVVMPSTILIADVDEVLKVGRQAERVINR